MRKSSLLCTLVGAVLASFLVVASASAAKSSTHGSGKATSRSAVFKVPGGWPQTLYVPQLGVTAPVESVALNNINDEHAPFKWTDVAWYNRGAKPGDKGHAAIFGHVDSTCCPAVFYHLRNLKPGDVIEVKYKKSPLLKFRVMWSKAYLNSKLPTKFLFGSSSERAVELITCDGIFHTSSGYDHKLVVYARLILPNGKLG